MISTMISSHKLRLKAFIPIRDALRLSMWTNMLQCDTHNHAQMKILVEIEIYPWDR